MSRDQRIDNAIQQSAALVAPRARPAISKTSATTEQFEDLTVQSAVPGAPTLVSRTDVEAEKEPHASKITAAVQLLTTAVGDLRDEVRSLSNQTKATRAEVHSLRVRHDTLREVVQAHGHRLDELDQAVLELTYHRVTIRGLLLTSGALVAMQLLGLGALAVLVFR